MISPRYCAYGTLIFRLNHMWLNCTHFQRFSNATRCEKSAGNATCVCGIINHWLFWHLIMKSNHWQATTWSQTLNAVSHSDNFTFLHRWLFLVTWLRHNKDSAILRQVLHLFPTARARALVVGTCICFYRLHTSCVRFLRLRMYLETFLCCSHAVVADCVILITYHLHCGH